MSKSYTTSVAIKRITRDIREITQNPLHSNGIYYVPDESDITVGHALLIGPKDTPYFGGYFFFRFQFPQNYPFSPPTVTFLTNGDGIRMHPNFYTCGKVCLSLLNTFSGEPWTACQSLSTILLSMYTLFTASPLLNEPLIDSSYIGFINDYTQCIKYASLNIAVCRILNREIGNVPYDAFWQIIKETFVANYDELRQIANKELIDVPNPSRRLDSFYHFRFIIDYAKVIVLLDEARQKIEV